MGAFNREKIKTKGLFNKVKTRSKDIFYNAVQKHNESGNNKGRLEDIKDKMKASNICLIRGPEE